MMLMGYVHAPSAQSAEEEATKPNSRVSVEEIADHAYGAPRLTWMANAGTNLGEK